MKCVNFCTTHTREPVLNVTMSGLLTKLTQLELNIAIAMIKFK